MNRERLMADAKAVALARAATTWRLARARRSRSAAKGCRRRSSSACTSRGAPAVSAITTRSSGEHWRASSAGGDRPNAGTVTEQELLDLEREAFLSLCGQRKTQERIAYTLKTGKTLRN